MPRLIIERPGAQPRLYELREGSTIHIGRAASNDITLPHSSISRSHALIESNHDSWVVTDQHSANGVLVNGVRVDRAELNSGDVIGLGDIKLRFENMDTGTVVAKASPELASHLTQIIDRESVAKLLDRSRPKPPSEWTESRVDSEARVEFLRRENRLLTLLYQVSRALGDKTTVEDVTQCVLDLVLQIDGAERGYAMLLTEDSLRETGADPHGYTFLPAIIRYRQAPRSASPQVALSRAIIHQVMESKGPLLVMDAKEDVRFSGSRSMAISGMQSAMCAPLASRDRLFGLLYVDNLSKRGTFTPEDLEVFAVIAAQAGLVIDRVLAKSEVKRQGVQLSALERFLSPAISKKIAAEAADIRLGGESQRITLLFADVRGFTTMAEKMKPREAVEVLNEFFARMTNVIFEHEGTLDKYLGDGLMALFGAPFALQNDAEAAVRAAADMQRSLSQLNDSSGRAPLHIGIGIHTGEAVVGFLGTERRMDYTAIGDTVNVASRLTSQAGPGQIVISAATYAHLCREIPCSRLSAMKLKGRAEPIDVHEVLWREFLPHSPAGPGLKPSSSPLT
ncbi:MAG TPA: adenylate/guanylate cyclase domain-containing protein [Candidatus Acidoferrum sp.]|jgi:adenylate cyclase|nr:adenylate/guanylate cyclase domain-containing protein [Candidatus Acidoferrum sp.]